MVAQSNDRQNLLYIDDLNLSDQTPNKSVTNTAGKSTRKNSAKKDAIGIDGMMISANQPMNVILLKNEVDLE